MKKNIKNLKQVHGKLEKNPQTLEQVWGEDGTYKYKTLDANKYQAQLDEMNLADLQEHAVEIAGIAPNDNRGTLIKRLVNEFNKHTAAFKPMPVIDDSTKNNKKAIDILSEGR